MNKKTLQLIVKLDVAAIILATLLWANFVASHYNGKLDLFNSVLIILAIVCSILAVFYNLVGFSKQYGSTIFKLFINVFSLFELWTLVNHQLQSSISIMMVAIRFAGLVLLSHTKDLGENKSKMISIMVIITSLVDEIVLVYQGILQTSWKGLLLELVLELTALLMIVAKYIDKKERGTI